MVAAGMEDQRLAFGPFIIFHFAKKNNVIAAIELADFAANEMRCRSFEQGQPARPRGNRPRRIYLERRGELPRKMMLVCRQHIDRKMAGLVKSASEAELREMLHRTSGGSSETDENELTVMPMRRPSLARVLTTVTPVANCPSARRKSRRSKRSAAASWLAGEHIRFVGIHEPGEECARIIETICHSLGHFAQSSR